MSLSVEDPLLQAELPVVTVEKVEILQGLRQEEGLLDIVVTSILPAGNQLINFMQKCPHIFNTFSTLL